MKNTKLSYKYVITNRKKFKEMLLKQGTYEQIAENLNFSDSYILKILSGEVNVSSKVINQIVEKYKLSYQDIGAEKVSIVFCKRINLLKEEKNEEISTISSEISRPKSTVYGWFNGDSFPNMGDIKELADHFKVSISYLLGETDVRYADNEAINEELGIDDKSIATYKEIKNSHFYGSENDKQIKKNFGFTYIDISNYIASNRDFVYAFFNEANRVLEYNSDFNYYEKFNDLLNRYEIDADIEANVESGTYGEMQLNTPYKVDVTDVAKQVLHRIIDDMFDKFIADKIKQNNLHLPTLEELSKMLNNK